MIGAVLITVGTVLKAVDDIIKRKTGGDKK